MRILVLSQAAPERKFVEVGLPHFNIVHVSTLKAFRAKAAEGGWAGAVVGRVFQERERELYRATGLAVFRLGNCESQLKLLPDLCLFLVEHQHSLEIQKLRSRLARELIDRRKLAQKVSEQSLREKSLQSELELRRDENELSSMSRIRLDSFGIIQNASYSAADLIGRSLAELEGTPLAVLLAPDEAEVLQGQLDSTRRADGAVLDQMYNLRDENGAVKHLKFTTQSEFTPKDCYSGLINLDVVDLSQEVRLREAVEGVQTLLEAIVDSLEDGVLTADRQGRIESANRAAGKLFDKPLENLAGKSLYGLMPSIDLSSDFPQSLWLSCATGQPFPVEARVTLVRLKNQLKSIIQVRDITDVRRYREEISDIRERERQWVGQELHDDLGQQFTALAFLAEVLAGKLRTHPIQAVKELGEQVAALAKQSIGKMRALARGLYPTLLERSGLAGALNELCSDIQEFYRVQLVLRATPVRVNKNVALHLFRIAQEAITNAVKHAKAKRIEIDLEVRGESLILSVRDNGVGMPSKVSTRGIGLRSMRHHAELIEGRLEIESGAGVGTRIACEAPCLPHFLEEG